MKKLPEVTYCKTLLLVLFSFIALASSAQIGVAYDLKKPARFENRTLASEKSNDGKQIKKVRRFIQNTVTHYNYYFNANEKLKTILARARAQNRDDYTRLLPFYNFTLEATLAQKRDLDSIIYKSTTGILIHDTRNDWIDNLYMLIGKSYFYRKDFDSAYITFQFVNYAFAPKEKDGYDLPIGSNANADQGGSADIVSTKEKRNVIQKAFSQPPSRNEALVWKVRTYLAGNRFPEAASLIEVLKNDPLFPARLHAELAEVQSLFFYKQNIYDSAAYYLERALPSASDHEEAARWEYLIAQLYENAKDAYNAKVFYERTIRHTYNPVLEVYARLNAIRQTRDSAADFIQKNIDALVHMGKKDRYEAYRDIIYYTAAQMELERNNKPGAIAFLRLCIRAAAENVTSPQRNKAFLQLANLSFDSKKYRDAKNFYDSLNISGDQTSLGDLSWLPERKAALAIIVNQLNVINRQDSLQRIAALPPDQRDAYIKKLVRSLRRQQGLRDEEDTTGGANRFNNNAGSGPADLFSSGSGSSADWYFNNASLKAKGYNDFKTKWGTRPNVDNWFLNSQLRSIQTAAGRSNERVPGQLDLNPQSATAANAPAAISFKSLQDNLPLTPDKMKKVLDSVEHALFTLGKAYQEGISDYPSAVGSYDTLLEKFPESKLRPETLLNLYYCYRQMHDDANAARILALMRNRYPNSPLTAKASNPDSVENATSSLRINATHQYEKIYTEFIEGNFNQALADKKLADSLYGDKYWTPQLLYIESVYHIRNRDDAKAINILGNINMKFPKTAMAAKAQNLIDVLKRRRQIEDYLTKLEVKRATDSEEVNTILPPAGPTKVADRPLLVRNDSNLLHKEDTSTLAKAKISGVPVAGGIKSPQGAPGMPGMDKLSVDTASMRKIVMSSQQISDLKRQMDSIQNAMIKAQADSMKMAELRRRSDSVQAAMARLQQENAQLAARMRAANSAFSNTPDKPHTVVVLMDKVDPVYITEARNAFNRWNLENFYDKQLNIDNSALNDSLRLVVINSFPTADAALDYLQKLKAVAPRELIPWLPANKYSFYIISAANLNILMNNKDLPGYKRFLQAVYPGKFP